MKPSNKQIWLGLVAVAMLGGAALVYSFPPGSVWFYPRCMFHSVTGLDCPGCGALRATHALLHGHFWEAFALNPLYFLLLPVLAWIVLSYALRATTGRELSHPFTHPAWVWMLLAAVVAFAVLRNLPMAPFSGLAPP